LTSYLAIYRTGLESKLILKLKTKIKSKTQTRYPPPIALSLPFSLHIRIAIPSRRSPPSLHQPVLCPLLRHGLPWSTGLGVWLSKKGGLQYNLWLLKVLHCGVAVQLWRGWQRFRPLDWSVLRRWHEVLRVYGDAVGFLRRTHGRV
jgi:hypothetical protein